MWQRMMAIAFCVLLPSAGWAQTAQESYLPAKSQLYFRWDGMQIHQAAFDKTAVGKMMQGEMGKFLVEFCRYVSEQTQNAARNEPRIGAYLKDAGKLVGSMHQHGIVLGIEVNQVIPPQAQAVLVFPKAAGESGTLLQLIDKIGEDTKADVKNVKVGKRLVHTIDVEFLKIGWWAQGTDAILYLGTNDPAAYAKDIDAKKTGIADSPLYARVAGFKDFSTCSRGYFDIGSVLKVASEIRPEVGPIIDELGLKSLKGMTFVTGFDGLAERSVVDVDVPSQRKGLLSFTSSKKISLKDLPVLPNDVNGFTASSINLNKTYDVITQAIDGIVKVVAPDKLDDIKEAIKAFEGAAGVDINKELFGSFGEVIVTYSSPTDGFLGTGSVVAVQVNDGKKLNRALEKLAKAVPANPAGEVILKKKPYRGGEIMQLHLVSERTNAHVASFGIYKNWFIYSAYPQPIKGFILRQDGELPAWKADESLTKALAEFPPEFNSIKVSDPRPFVQTTLAITPLVMNIINSVGSAAAPFFLPGFQPFDLDLIPHAQDATRHLFPNVTIGIDEGKRYRTQTRGSLLLPF